MLEKVNKVDLIEVINGEIVQVRTATIILEDGEEINRKFHRHVIAPGDDYKKEDARVQTICAAVHTPKVIADYQAMQEAARLPS
jgi:hypothetical protein